MTQTIEIDIDDVRRAGSVVQAIIDRCPDEILVATADAVGMSTFSTSGPGSGWSKQHDANDYAAQAVHTDVHASGCLPSESSVIDPEDGRLAHGVDPDEGEEWDGEIEWEDRSCVKLVCPSYEDALEHVDALAKMAESLDTHEDETDLDDWRKLIGRIREAAASLDGIEV